MTWSENFEALKNMAADAAQAVGKKTKELATTAKANLAIRGEEEKIRKAQLELGKLYYRDFVVGEEPDTAEYLPWCEKITASKEAIEELKASLEDPEDFEEAEEEAQETEAVPEEQTEQESCPACQCQEAPAEEAPVAPEEPAAEEEAASAEETKEAE